MKDFDGDDFARKLASAMQLDTWRRKVGEDSYNSRWKNIFNHIEPDETVTLVLGKLLNVTGGSVSPTYLQSLVLAAWTYGYSAACSALADEEITLWQGEKMGNAFDDMEPECEV